MIMLLLLLPLLELPMLLLLQMIFLLIHLNLKLENDVVHVATAATDLYIGVGAVEDHIVVVVVVAGTVITIHSNEIATKKRRPSVLQDSNLLEILNYLYLF